MCCPRSMAIWNLSLKNLHAVIENFNKSKHLTASVHLASNVKTNLSRWEVPLCWLRWNTSSITNASLKNIPSTLQRILQNENCGKRTLAKHNERQCFPRELGTICAFCNFLYKPKKKSNEYSKEQISLARWMPGSFKFLVEYHCTTSDYVMLNKG